MLSLSGGCRGGHPDSPAPQPGSADPAAALRAALGRVPLVGLGETHGVKEYGAFLESVIGNQEITDQLDDIVVEFGSSDHQGTMDRYVAGEAVSAAEIEQVLRDTTQLLVWDSPIYANVFAAVRRANQHRPASRRLRVVLADPAIDWATTHTREDHLKISSERDRHFAAVVEREVLAKQRRALLLAGQFHLLKQGSPRDTVGSLLEQRHPGTLFVVMLYAGLGPHTAEAEAALASSPRPAVISLAASSLGALPARSAFVLPPVLQVAEGLTLRDIADAYLYLGPTAALTEVYPPGAIYRDPEYIRELERRYPIVFGAPLDARQLLDRAP